jgi:hypothetical protein
MEATSSQPISPLSPRHNLPTVRLVRLPDGSSRLLRIPAAHPWVLRKPWLVLEDVD